MSRRKAAEAPPPENHERWIVTYADMVTLLFALFVVLWAISEVDEVKFEQVRTSLGRAFDPGVLGGDSGSSPIFDSGGAVAPGIAEAKEQVLSVIKEELLILEAESGAAFGGRIQLREDQATVTVSLADNLLFDSGSARLKPGSQDVLMAVASSLNAIPNRIRIEGHTDNVSPAGSVYQDNWELSAERAESVLLFLKDVGGIEPSRLAGEFFADTVPIAPNDTPEGRALNRRADIVILFDAEGDATSEAAGEEAGVGAEAGDGEDPGGGAPGAGEGE